MAEGKLLQANGYDEITAHAFGTVLADSFASTLVKFGFQNDKARAVTPTVEAVISGTSDMYSLMNIRVDTVTLSCPYNLAASLASQVHSLVADTYYYVLTAVNSLGQTGPSLEVSTIVTTPSLAPKLTWNALTGALSYKIFRSTISGAYTNTLVTTIATYGTVQYTDIGSATNNDSPPIINTTAGTSPGYATAPSTITGFASSLELASVQIGEQRFFWVGINAGSGISEADNPRQCILRISE